jgi:hypothetical protein
VRRREDYVREKKLCEMKVCVSFSVCSRLALATCSPTAGPPLHVERSSSGHFPPPRTPEWAKHQMRVQENSDHLNFHHTFNFAHYGCGGGVVPERLVTCSTFRGGPPTPPLPQRTPKSRKTVKFIKFYKYQGGGGA